MPELAILRAAVELLWSHFRMVGRGEEGSATLEQILVTLSLVAAAVAAGAVIVAKVTDQARSIPTPGSP